MHRSAETLNLYNIYTIIILPMIILSYLGATEGVHSCFDARKVPLTQRGAGEQVATDAAHVLAGAGAAARATGGGGRPMTARGTVRAVRHVLHSEILGRRRGGFRKTGSATRRSNFAVTLCVYSPFCFAGTPLLCVHAQSCARYAHKNE